MSEPVEVLWDRWGVPHIYASTVHDLFFERGVEKPLTQYLRRLTEMQYERTNLDLARERGLKVIEDAAVAEVDQRAVGRRVGLAQALENQARHVGAGARGLARCP